MPTDSVENDEPPLAAWELPERRFRLPADLQRRIGAQHAVVRVAIEIDEKMKRHSYVTDLYVNLTETIAEWQQISEVHMESSEVRWRVIRQIEEPHSGKTWPLLIVLGKARDGGCNLVSMHRRNQSFVDRLRREGALEERIQGDNKR
jgi:hypothetical protein